VTSTKRYALASVKVPDGEDAFPGSFEVVLSTPEVDRDGESIEVGAFEPLPEHITFDVDHGMSTETTVGSGTPRYEDGQLKVAGTWSSLQRAQDVRTLVREKHIRTTSVAYMGATYEQKDGVPTVTKAELLNGAFVAIPSNRGAVVLSAKAYAAELEAAGPVLKAGARNSGSDATRLQTIHDLATENGASCETKAAPRARTSTKAPGMSASDLAAALSATVETVHGGERRYTWVRDYGDDWVVFSADGMAPTGLFRQKYTVTDGVVNLDGETEAVRSRTVYEPVPENSSTDNAPKSAASAATSSASAVVRARQAAATASATLALINS
jgi:hypothetical protein